MYNSSTHFKNWTLSCEEDLLWKKLNVNIKYIKKLKETKGINDEFLLSAIEEQTIVQHYKIKLYDFCKRMVPKLPQNVINTAFHYYERFFLTVSVMEHHPKEILVTCVYLAAKIEEFFLPLFKFVANLKGNQENAREVILSKEIVILEYLNFNLVVYHPFKPLDGFFIHLKVGI
uniref:Cyclin-like domain-containing protein n=2 Tax=Clastoptera arizonana TaxID=38151 RepID=A0A1B6D0D8_9HEMI